MDDLREIAPNLENIKREDPFKVPEGYFENLPLRISERVHAEKSRPVPGFARMVLRPYYVMATVFLAVLIAGGVYYLNQPGKGDNNSASAIAVLLDENLYYYSEETLIETMHSNPGLNTEVQSLSRQEIIDYLINEDITITEIIDAL